MRGKRRKLHASTDFQLPKNVLQMRLHGFCADAELCGDLFVRHPLHRPGGDLLLPIGQDLLHPRQGSLQLIDPLTKAFHHPAQELARRPQLSGVGGANGLDKFNWRSRLERTPLGTALQGPSDELLLEKISEEQGLRPRALGTNYWEPYKPAQLGHPNIQQQDMRLKCFHSTQHLAAIRCVADDLNIFMLRQRPAEPLPEEGMSVSDEYRDRVHTVKIPIFPVKEEQPLLACRDNSLRINASCIVPAFNGL
jgi:hypothetical protein